MTKLDTRGLSCPQPVLTVLNCIKKEQAKHLEVLVDNDASEENVRRAGVSSGYTVTVHKDNADVGTTTLVLEKA